MASLWCRACARRQPEGTEVKCRHCGHTGLVSGRLTMIADFAASLRTLIPEIISFTAGVASIPAAFHFFHSQNSCTKGAITICLVGTAVGSAFAPSRLIRMALVSIVGQTLFVFAIPFLFRSWFPETSSLNFAMTVIFVNLVSPIASAVGSIVGLVANRLFFLLNDVAAGNRAERTPLDDV